MTEHEETQPPADTARRLGPRITALEILLAGAGLFGVLHYAWLMDDAFVYFRYVDNYVLRGFGLVWNAGEYVEGFSSALWCLFLIGLRSIGLDFWLSTRLLGVLCFLLFVASLIALDRRLSPQAVPSDESAKIPRANLPLAYLGLGYGVLCYFTSGLETPLVQVAAVAYALFTLNPSSRTLQLFLGTTPLLRHELALPFAMALAWFVWRERRVPWAMLLSVTLVLGGWLLFRITYYADLFPNTFYLKDQSDYAQGWLYLLDTTRTYHFLPFVLVNLALLGGLLMRGKERRSELHLGPRAVMVIMALSFALYRIRIGGDPRHFRYLAFPFVLLVCASGGIVPHVLATLRFPKRHLLASALTLLVAVGTALLYPRQLDSHPFTHTETSETVDLINDASGHRHHKTLKQPSFGKAIDLDLEESYAAWNSERPYAKVDTHSWCVKMFREYDVRWIHRLGLTDAFLARTNAPPSPFDRPAHKHGLIPLAHDIVAVFRLTPEPGRGMFRRAVEQRRAAPWIAVNLESFELIERKVFNGHDFFENLRLAFQFPARLQPGRNGR